MKKKSRKDHSLSITISIMFILIVLPITVGFLQQKQQTEQLAATSQPQPNGITGNWNMIFDDEFNSTSLDTSKWAPYWFQNGATQNGTVMQRSNVSESGGYLNLQVSATSGGIVSTNPSAGGHFQFTYGAMEARINIPASGTQIANWPAWWTDGQHWPTDGEIDVIEGLHGRACYHFPPANNQGGCPAGSYTGWHTFGADWEPGIVTYYYDGKDVGTINSGITSAPMYLILENSDGSSGGSKTPTTMQVDYVRVWQKCTTNCSPTIPSVAISPILVTPTPLPIVNPITTNIPRNCSGLTVTTPLKLNRTTVSPGQRISGTVTYTNNCTNSYRVKDIVIYGQSPNGTHYDFLPETRSLTVKQGQQVKISATLVIPKNVRTGKWIVVSSFQNTSGTWKWDGANQKYINVK